MARIKYVTNERRHTYERALQAYEQQKEAALAAVSQAEAQALTEAEAKAQAEHAAQVAAARKEAADERSAAKLVGAGLFESAPQSMGSQTSSEGKSP